MTTNTGDTLEPLEKRLEDLVREKFYPGPVAGSTKRFVAALIDAFPELSSSPREPETSEREALALSDDTIKIIVSRFLSWRLPENFSPDNGISFKKTFNEHTAHPMKHEPTGTNLFDATQAEAMVRHMLEGVAQPAQPGPDDAVGPAEREVGIYVYKRIERLIGAQANTAEGRELSYLANIVSDVEEYGAEQIDQTLVGPSCHFGPHTSGAGSGEELWAELAKRTNLSLDTAPSDIEGEPDEWVVYRVSGGRNDREWTEVSRATTPRAAVRSALSAAPSSPEVGRMEDE